MPEPSFADLLGRALVWVEVSAARDRVDFTTDDGQRWRLYHSQDCCESVWVEDVIGDLGDLLGSPLLIAEERVSRDPQVGQDHDSDSFTWTFYELATIRGSVTFRWYGESNGYYSEDVDFAALSERHPVLDWNTWTIAGDFTLNEGLVDDSDEPDLAARYRAYFSLGGK